MLWLSGISGIMAGQLQTLIVPLGFVNALFSPLSQNSSAQINRKVGRELPCRLFLSDLELFKITTHIHSHDANNLNSFF